MALYEFESHPDWDEGLRLHRSPYNLVSSKLSWSESWRTNAHSKDWVFLPYDCCPDDMGGRWTIHQGLQSAGQLGGSGIEYWCHNRLHMNIWHHCKVADCPHYHTWSNTRIVDPSNCSSHTEVEGIYLVVQQLQHRTTVNARNDTMIVCVHWQV
jgi:hypothetical protein